MMRMAFGDQAAKRRAGIRGFTLIELLVAIIAGLLVALSAFAFSKHSSRFFAQESRMASAQMSVLAGFQRLQTDVSRASFMSTPNMVRDRDFTKVCAPSSLYDAWPDLMKTMTGIGVEQGGSYRDSALAESCDEPDPDAGTPEGGAATNCADKIRLTGNFSSAEPFPVRTIIQTGTGHDVYLQVNNGPMSRHGLVEGADMTQIFAPGRIIRILDQQGKEEYEVIKAAAYPSGGQPVISTELPLPLKGELASSGAGSAPCGIDGLAIGVQANPVSIIEYGLANLSGLSGTAYENTIYGAAATAPGDQYRTELIRREVFPKEAYVEYNVDPSAEVVAEYAMDLRFGLWVTDGVTPGLQFVAPGSAAVNTLMTVAGSYALGVPPSGPESVRSVEIEFVVRSREVDRVEGLGAGYRRPIPNDGGFARVRTLRADVTLMNQAGET